MTAASALLLQLACAAALCLQLARAEELAFASPDAFCRYHCSPTHVARVYRALREQSKCTPARCPDHVQAQGHARALEETHSGSTARWSFATGAGVGVGDVLASVSARDQSVHSRSHSHSRADEDVDEDPSKAVQVVDVVACRGLDAERAKVSLTLGDPARHAFEGFHAAFSAAYDAMLGGANATLDACRLQFVEDQLLDAANKPTNAKAKANANATLAPPPPQQQQRRPMLVKLAPDADELACLDAIHAIWTPVDESLTPFLTRRDSPSDAAATVLLLHLPPRAADRIVDLGCVASVTQLPAVLKLTPFARASVALARDPSALAGPALEVRLVKGSDTARVESRLSSAIQEATGITNALRRATSSDRVLRLAAMDAVSAWAACLALLLRDDAVEWIDLETSVQTGSLRPGQAFEQRLLALELDNTTTTSSPIVRRRRLDAFVQNLVGASQVRAQKITGNGIIVGVTDTGLYVDHDQFDQPSRDIYDRTDLSARKVVLYKTFGNREDESEQVTCGHGTHVSGILAGQSLSRSETDLGIASSARIAFMDIGRQSPSCVGQRGCEVKLETPGEVEALMGDQVAAGARIFSFSWGTGGNDYNAQSRDLDDYIYRNPDVLIIVAAGNSGDKGKRTISSPSGAKNVISVGASLNDAASFSKTPCASVLNQQTVASFSSVGPTLDGRLKPDIVAPGMVIESAQSEAPGSTTKSNALCPLQGTSQATPIVAGMAVLLYEWLRDGWWKHGVKDAKYGIKTVPAALLKALIIHSGERMTRRLVAPRNGITSCVAMEASAMPLLSYPDIHQGYGKPTMANLVSFVDDQGAGVYFFPNGSEGSEPRVTQGSTAKFTFMLKERANLRVTLVWTDPAGSIGGRIALQNDLDLSVRVPETSTVFYPLSGNGSRDAINNVEMVEVSYEDIKAALDASGVKYNDKDGLVVEASVHGYSVKAGSRAGQTFALVASSSPSLIETSALSEQENVLWKPWMTIGIVVGGTMAILLAIGIGWRWRRARARSASALPDRRPHRSGSNNAYVSGNADPRGHQQPPPRRAPTAPPRPQQQPPSSRQTQL
ncbi:hypothetical protein P43SY_007436 [Pythium insidiosum]|uniref:subtilisin n=1 Tax=Pythium insidiosum TaxID=114742 RepID=A0AAD5LZM7_PYTIN|nr:hypothetical protein P43SY_007436 [Pythium insidiosum]